MALILGIDAAWTETGSSGVALLNARERVCHLIAVAPSYESFIASADGVAPKWERKTGRAPDVGSLLRAASSLGGGRIDVVAIDMPVARVPITGRRVADDRISITFGAARAGTHSPSVVRPGAFGERVARAFVSAGYSLATNVGQTQSPALVEVFPLAALVRLMKLSTRPPYKTAKTSRYWPGKTRQWRINQLLRSWSEILTALELDIANIRRRIPLPTAPSAIAHLKPYEDALDAIICAWIGACVVQGKADPFGDQSAAIWVPTAIRGNV